MTERFDMFKVPEGWEPKHNYYTLNIVLNRTTANGTEYTITRLLSASRPIYMLLSSVASPAEVKNDSSVEYLIKEADKLAAEDGGWK